MEMPPIADVAATTSPTHSSTVSNGFDGGVKVPRVADHVAVGKVQDDNVVNSTIDALDNLTCELIRTHLRYKIISGVLPGGGNEEPVLAFINCFIAAV